jgi:hypothetical protein
VSAVFLCALQRVEDLLARYIPSGRPASWAVPFLKEDAAVAFSKTLDRTWGGLISHAPPVQELQEIGHALEMLRGSVTETNGAAVGRFLAESWVRGAAVSKYEDIIELDFDEEGRPIEEVYGWTVQVSAHPFDPKRLDAFRLTQASLPPLLAPAVEGGARRRVRLQEPCLGHASVPGG